MNQTDLHGRPYVCYGDALRAAENLWESPDECVYNLALVQLISELFDEPTEVVMDSLREEPTT